jgi:hypothetical protein
MQNRRRSMTAMEKWAERLYSETDVGRSVGTSLAGALGLGIYLKFGDWVIAIFASVIFFPVARLIASAAHKRVTRRSRRRAESESTERIYDRLSDEERTVVSVFVGSGGCVITWGQMNNSSVSANGVESLIQRGLLSTSVTADGMRETFVLDSDLFGVGLRRSREFPAS